MNVGVRVLAIGLLLSVAACSCDDGFKGVGSQRLFDAGSVVIDPPPDAGVVEVVGHLKVCALENGVPTTCAAEGASLGISFGETPLGRGTKQFALISDGTADLFVSGAAFSGVSDFRVSPDPSMFEGRSMQPGEQLVFTVDFEASIPGARTARISFETVGASNEVPEVELIAVGDDSQVCVCVVEDSGCRPTTLVEFDGVPSGLNKSRSIRLSACGTAPVELQTVAVREGSSGFSVSELMDGNKTLVPGGAPIQLEVMFTPWLPQPYLVPLDIVSTSRRMVVDLQGLGVGKDCRLKASPSRIDYGKVIEKMTDLRMVKLTNEGVEDCVFSESPSITVGSDTFTLQSTSFGFISGGTSKVLQVTYRPPDRAGPDVGELSIPHFDGASGASMELKIELTGTPVSVPECVLQVTPGDMVTSQRTINFGSVAAGTVKILRASLKNIGDADCTVSSARIEAGAVAFASGLDASVYRVTAAPTAPIRPGDTAFVEVTFIPTAETDYGAVTGSAGPSLQSANLVVHTSDVDLPGQDCGDIRGGLSPTKGCVAWGLAGKGGKSDLVAVPPTIDFGTVGLGCRSDERQLSLVNKSNFTVTVKELRVEPPGAPTSPFQFTFPAVPFTIAGGATTNLPGRFVPSATGAEAGKVVIVSDAVASPRLEVPLTALGVANATQTDTFLQDGSGKSDVLFVIDNSQSMAQEQALLAGNTQAFVNVLEASNVDYHIAIVTTDVAQSSQSGNFMGTPKFVTPFTPAPASSVASTVNALGTKGSPREQGLRAMYLALTDPLISDPAKNGGFLRSDASLAVIVVSDEEDSSPNTSEYYQDFLWGLKGPNDRSLITFSAVVGPLPGGCYSSNGSATAGTRYLDLQQRTGGVFRSICSANWSTIAQDLAASITTVRNKFRLSRQANAGSIVVKVDGVPAMATDWSYDAASNSIVFAATAIPTRNAVVTATYDAICY